MNTGEKHVIKTTWRKTTISEIEDGLARSRGNRHPIRRPNKEDLLEFYLRRQDDIFTLPCPSSLRRDIEVLQCFMKMHEPPGDVIREEVVIETEVTEIEKKNNLTEAANQMQE
ncbi:uncharacterized protein LOC114062127 isoform X2 [Empidonax traillii]|nr:uncharacterized protein LOC114062127 isoform X2 [Empidonax traillii]